MKIDLDSHWRRFVSKDVRELLACARLEILFNLQLFVELFQVFNFDFENSNIFLLNQNFLKEEKENKNFRGEDSSRWFSLVSFDRCPSQRKSRNCASKKKRSEQKKNSMIFFFGSVDRRTEASCCFNRLIESRRSSSCFRCCLSRIRFSSSLSSCSTRRFFLEQFIANRFVFSPIGITWFLRFPAEVSG